MNDTAQQGIQSIQFHNRQIDFRYFIDRVREEAAVEYWVYLTADERANESPIKFWIRKHDDQWQTGIYVNDQFISETDIICTEITDTILRADNFFSIADKRHGWQRFSLDTSHGKFCFSEQLNGYRVVYKQKIGFLENSDELMPDEEFIMIRIGAEWLTCKVLGENSREIFSSPHTNEIKTYILETHKNA